MIIFTMLSVSLTMSLLLSWWKTRRRTIDRSKQRQKPICSLWKKNKLMLLTEYIKIAIIFLNSSFKSPISSLLLIKPRDLCHQWWRKTFINSLYIKNQRNLYWRKLFLLPNSKKNIKRWITLCINRKIGLKLLLLKIVNLSGIILDWGNNLILGSLSSISWRKKMQFLLKNLSGLRSSKNLIFTTKDFMENRSKSMRESPWKNKRRSQLQEQLTVV